jgi:hypothetical protein
VFKIPSALVAGALVLAFSATSVLAGGDTSVGSDGTPPAPGGGGAVRVSPDPTVVDLHRTAWDHIRISANGKRLVVYFWMGAQDCYGLGKVNVVQKGGTLKIKLWTGTRATAKDMACIDIAQLYKTVIYLR